MLADKAIHSITKFTTLDFQEHLASIFWFAKCNMACLYCYNPNIVRENGNISLNEALEFLKSRQGRLEGVVLSGGECTLYPYLEEFCKAIKELGFKIKIDTNGTNPTLLKCLIDGHLVDFIALDYKAPKYKFEAITNSHHFERFEESLKLLIQTDFAFEARTTLHQDLLNEDDINAIIFDLHEKGYKNRYFIQHFLNVPTLGHLKEPIYAFDKTKLSNLLEISFRNQN